MNTSFKAGDEVRVKGRTEVGTVRGIVESYATVEYPHDGRTSAGHYPLEQLEHAERAPGVRITLDTPPPKAPVKPKAKASDVLPKVVTGLNLLLLLLLAGCARMTQTLVTTTTHTNGVMEVRQSRATGWALWDAKQTLEKLRVSNGKTHSIGLTGAEQEANTTNAAATLDAVTRLLQAIR